jgi:hypothetical protein
MSARISTIRKLAGALEVELGKLTKPPEGQQLAAA